MGILERYIAKNVIASILLVMVVLMGIDLFFYTIDELRYLGKGEYNLNILCWFVFLKIPTKVYALYPWAVILGVLLALGNFAKNSELIAMQVAAISVRKIALYSMQAVFILTIIMFFFGEYIAPKTEWFAQNSRTQAISRGQTLKTEYGTWVRNNDEFVHIGTIQADDTLFDITRYVFDENLKLQEITVASKAILAKDGTWILSNVTGTKFTDDKTYRIKEDKVVINKLFNTKILATMGVTHLDRLSINSLYVAIKMRKENALNAVDYQLAFWNKVFRPIVILILAFAVVPFVFGQLRSSSIGLKILVGAIVGFGFHTLNTIFAPLMLVINLSPVIAAMLPGVLFLIFGMIMMKRVR